MLSQHILTGQQTFMDAGNAAKTKAQAVLPRCGSHAVYMAQHQRLKHEAAA